MCFILFSLLKWALYPHETLSKHNSCLSSLEVLIPVYVGLIKYIWNRFLGGHPVILEFLEKRCQRNKAETNYMLSTRIYTGSQPKRGMKYNLIKLDMHALIPLNLVFLVICVGQCSLDLKLKWCFLFSSLGIEGSWFYSVGPTWITYPVAGKVVTESEKRDSPSCVGRPIRYKYLSAKQSHIHLDAENKWAWYIFKPQP